MAVTENRKLSKKIIFIVSVALLSVIAITVGITLSYIQSRSNAVVNEFVPATVGTKIVEDFSDGINKKNVNITNTSDATAYVRIKLVTYRVNENGDHIGGVAEIPEFTPGQGWIKMAKDTYVYKNPIGAGRSPENPLIGAEGIKLSSYDDEDGGVQVVEVFGEGIQCQPSDAVKQAWGVTVSGSVITGLAD